MMCAKQLLHRIKLVHICTVLYHVMGQSHQITCIMYILHRVILRITYIAYQINCSNKPCILCLFNYYYFGSDLSIINELSFEVTILLSLVWQCIRWKCWWGILRTGNDAISTRKWNRLLKVANETSDTYLYTEI